MNCCVRPLGIDISHGLTATLTRSAAGYRKQCAVADAAGSRRNISGARCMACRQAGNTDNYDGLVVTHPVYRAGNIGRSYRPSNSPLPYTGRVRPRATAGFSGLTTKLLSAGAIVVKLNV